MKKKVVVIMGGISSEREVSLNSGRSVLESINRDKYDVYELIIDEAMDVVNKMPQDVDFALIVLHGKFGEDGTIQSMLESMNIPYSGCNPLTSGICMDKNMSKKVLVSSNIPTAPWTIVKSVDSIDYDAIEEIGYPVFIKPNSGGSSVATFKVDKKEDVEEAVRKGLEVDDIVMIEGYLPGDEYTSFILNGEIYPTIRITSPNEFFDYESKYDTGAKAATEEIVYLEESLQNQVNSISAQCWDSFNCKAFIRVDLILSNGIFYVLELNTLPGMTKTSLIPKSANAKGLPYSELIDKIIEYSL
ncbi:D-alanine--D-alanine ligase [Intestinibacter sp.]